MTTHGPKTTELSAVERFNTLFVGDTMPDGTVYAGVSPTTGTAMFATPADGPLSRVFKEARDHANGLYAHGHIDWRVPTHDELRVLFQNRSAIGGFTGRAYWSSTLFGHSAVITQKFRDPYEDEEQFEPATQMSLRCVRG